MQNTLRAERDKLHQFEIYIPPRLFIVGGLRPANHLQVGYGSPKRQSGFGAVPGDEVIYSEGIGTFRGNRTEAFNTEALE